MKKLFVLLLLSAQVLVHGQQLTNYNFAQDGFNISAGFPGRPSKDSKKSSNSSMLTLTDTKDGVTYALILTNTESNAIASQSAANTVQKIWSGAKQRDLQQPSSVAGSPSTYLKYISSNGTYIISQTFSSGVMMCQAMVLQKNNYVGEYVAGNFFSTIIFGAYSKNTNSNPVTNNGVYKKYDKVEVYNRNDGKWYKGKIRTINTDGTYEINYDEFRKDNENGVTADRIRAANE